WRLAVAISEIVVLVVLFNAVHTQFHLLAPGLERRGWFRTARRRHELHHDADENFMVGDHFWDRVFGTFRQGGDSPRPGSSSLTSLAMTMSGIARISSSTP